MATQHNILDELRGRIRTIERDIERHLEDVAANQKREEDAREYIASLEALKVDYENVIMLAFNNADKAKDTGRTVTVTLKADTTEYMAALNAATEATKRLRNT